MCGVAFLVKQSSVWHAREASEVRSSMIRQSCPFCCYPCLRQLSSSRMANDLGIGWDFQLASQNRSLERLSLTTSRVIMQVILKCYVERHVLRVEKSNVQVKLQDWRPTLPLSWMAFCLKIAVPTLLPPNITSPRATAKRHMNINRLRSSQRNVYFQLLLHYYSCPNTKGYTKQNKEALSHFIRKPLLPSSPGVSIKFEVGSWLEKNNQLYEQGAVTLTFGGLGHALPENFKIQKLWNAISSILGTKLSGKHKGRLLINSNIFLYFYNTNKLKMADLLTKREGCTWTRKRPVMSLIFHPFVSFVFLRTHLTVLGKKTY